MYDYEIEEPANEANVEEIAERFARIKLRYSERDVRMTQIRAIRSGKMSDIAPDIFPTNGAFQEPIVANMIDVAARDMADMIAPLPTLSCSSPNMTTDKARAAASLRSKIALGYFTISDMQVQMYSAADQYISYGMLPMRVEVDYDRKSPVIRPLDPIGSYFEMDRFNRVTGYFQHVTVSRDELCYKYPELESQIMKKQKYGQTPSREAEVIFYHDKDWDLAYLDGAEPIILSKVPNPIGKVLVRPIARPGVTEIPRGQFDDVIFLQLAKARFAFLTMEAAGEAVHAPIVVPADVPEVPLGAGAIIRTNNPGGVGRVKLELPQAAFAEQQSLERELQMGARFPSVRTGNSDASIVTGKGVEALMGGYDSQIAGHRAIFARGFEELIGICFELDEKLFGDEKKSLRGSDAGVAYEIEYVPAKAIAGNYTVEVTYGLMAGLDPNRWLVFGLQALGAGLLSREFLRREMPFDIDIEQEARNADIEDMSDALKQAIMGYAQSIPALASQGQDPSGPLRALASVIDGRRAGKALSDLIVEAFTPPAPPTPTPEEIAAQQAAQGQPGAPESMGPDMMQGAPGQMPEGLMANGMMQGVAPGQAGQAPGGRPDLQTLLAGLDSRGNANLSASVKRQTAV